MRISQILITMLLALTLPVTTLASSEYTDISDSDWVKPHLNHITQYYPNALNNSGNFSPYTKLSRAEAAKIIINIANLDVSKQFKDSKYNKVDIEKSDWQYDIMEAARYHKVLNGQVYSNNPKNLYLFPNKPVTRCEFAKMAVSAVCKDESKCKKELTFIEFPVSEENPFYEYVRKVYESNASSRTDFRCYEPIKRNEAIKILRELDISSEIKSNNEEGFKGEIPLEIDFIYSQPEQNNMQYLWDFGDSTELKQGYSVNHKYTKPGKYISKLKITYENGDEEEYTKDVYVESNKEYKNTGMGSVPVPTINIDQDNGIVPLTVNFDASSSFDSDGEIIAYIWDFGDRTTPFQGGSRESHIFENVGIHNVKLTIVDNDGLRSEETIEIIVNRDMDNFSY